MIATIEPDLWDLEEAAAKPAMRISSEVWRSLPPSWTFAAAGETYAFLCVAERSDGRKPFECRWRRVELV